MTENNFEITEAVALKVLEIVDQGLSNGLGQPVPGQMCVEAAVCYALGMEHGDEPNCVDQVLRNFKIGLNDMSWSSNQARAKGMRRLAVVQLGSIDALDHKKFCDALIKEAVAIFIPLIRADFEAGGTTLRKDLRCNTVAQASVLRQYIEEKIYDSDVYHGPDEVVYSIEKALSYYKEGYYTSCVENILSAFEWYFNGEGVSEIQDAILSDFAERVVQILVRLKVPGAAWLGLTEG